MGLWERDTPRAVGVGSQEGSPRCCCQQPNPDRGLLCFPFIRDLTDNQLVTLPLDGLGGLTHLKLQGNPALSEPFPKESFPRMRYWRGWLWLLARHCLSLLTAISLLLPLFIPCLPPAFQANRLRKLHLLLTALLFPSLPRESGAAAAGLQPKHTQVERMEQLRAAPHGEHPQQAVLANGIQPAFSQLSGWPCLLCCAGVRSLKGANQAREPAEGLQLSAAVLQCCSAASASPDPPLQWVSSTCSRADDSNSPEAKLPPAWVSQGALWEPRICLGSAA